MVREGGWPQRGERETKGWQTKLETLVYILREGSDWSLRSASGNFTVIHISIQGFAVARCCDWSEDTARDGGESYCY